MKKLILILLFVTAGCESVPTCFDFKDMECIKENMEPEEIRWATKHFGSCYSFGRAICEKTRECYVHGYDRDECIDWWIDNVCLVPADRRSWDHCASWASKLDCRYFIYGDDYYDGNEQPCEDMYPHPLMDQDPRVITEGDIDD